MIDISIDTKKNMNIEVLKNIYKGSGVDDLSDNAQVIHSSMWAATIKDKRWVYKFYYYKDNNKILQEIELLRMMKQFPVEVFKDKRNRLWSKTPYLFVQSINESDSGEWLYSNLRRVINRWQFDEILCSMVKNTWESQMKPYMIKVVETYLPEYKSITPYIRTLQGNQFIHGDFTLSNVMRHEDKIIVFDFEMANIGPEKWDETSFVYSLYEQKYYELGEKLFELFDCSLDMLYCIAIVRLAAAYKKDVNVKRRKEVLAYIARRKDDEKNI